MEGEKFDYAKGSAGSHNGISSQLSKHGWYTGFQS